MTSTTGSLRMCDVRSLSSALLKKKKFYSRFLLSENKGSHSDRDWNCRRSNHKQNFGLERSIIKMGDK